MKYVMVALLAVTLLWHDNSDNEDGFMVEKAISSCTDGFELFAYVGVSVTSVVDSMAVAGNCYRVAAFNNDGVSTYSNTAQYAGTPPPECRNKGKKCR